VNGLTLLTLIALAVGAYLAFRAGVMKGRREARTSAPAFPVSTSPALPAGPPVPVAVPSAEARPAAARDSAAATPERTLPVQAGADAPDLASRDAELVQLRAFAEDRRTLLAVVADARADVARYRQIVVDIENNAPPPLLAGPGAPDDLRLIVGIGPVLERMLQQLGVATYRQIARWTERDIDHFDARLPEFHGRVRRDDWVTQARELHLSKYGERP
jgi:predicted flap endonuclease-1-like 5' DNA nuclease